MKFKVGDEVKTTEGNGIIVFIDVCDENVPYLVKIKGINGMAVEKVDI